MPFKRYANISKVNQKTVIGMFGCSVSSPLGLEGPRPRHRAPRAALSASRAKGLAHLINARESLGAVQRGSSAEKHCVGEWMSVGFWCHQHFRCACVWCDEHFYL